MSDKKIEQLPTDFLEPNPLQPRGDMDNNSLEELKNSIEIHGIIEPLIVAKTPAGYQIIAGERRWRAAKLIGLKTVPAIIHETTPQQMLEMAIIENLQREDLSAIDRARSFQRLKEEFKINFTEIAKRMGKSVPYVVNSIRLLSLPDALKDGLLGGLITEGHARALAGINDTRGIIEAYKQVLREKASVRRAEEIARAFKEKLNREKESGENVKIPQKSELENLSDLMEKKLKIPALNVKIHQSKAMTKIEFRLRGDRIKGTKLIEQIKTIIAK